jgi:hypothetical protein
MIRTSSQDAVMPRAASSPSPVASLYASPGIKRRHSSSSQVLSNFPIGSQINFHSDIVGNRAGSLPVCVTFTSSVAWNSRHHETFTLSDAAIVAPMLSRGIAKPVFLFAAVEFSFYKRRHGSTSGSSGHNVTSLKYRRNPSQTQS